jgi:predicted ABC-type sugar transport system permease subunit
MGGAFVGSLILPGIGTIIGTVVGGVICSISFQIVARKNIAIIENYILRRRYEQNFK